MQNGGAGFAGELVLCAGKLQVAASQGHASLEAVFVAVQGSRAAEERGPLDALTQALIKQMRRQFGVGPLQPVREKTGLKQHQQHPRGSSGCNSGVEAHCFSCVAGTSCSLVTAHAAPCAELSTCCVCRTSPRMFMRRKSLQRR